MPSPITRLLELAEEGDREHQLSSGPGGEERQVCARLQTDAEDSETRQGQAGDHC